MMLFLKNQNKTFGPTQSGIFGHNLLHDIWSLENHTELMAAWLEFEMRLSCFPSASTLELVMAGLLPM